MDLKVAVVGLAPSTYDDAPWMDDEWQKWGMPWDARGWPLMARHFEMHERRMMNADPFYTADYIERLGDCERLYLQAPDERFPHAIAYPLDEVAQTIGGAYWSSSIGYMLALAIHEGATEIGIWGVDAADEYQFQRQNIEYLIGLARGKGIKVHIPDASPLCKFPAEGLAFAGQPTNYSRYGCLG